MKKYLFGMVAVVLATASVAFTRPKPVTGTYWFPTNSSGVLQSYIKSNNTPYTTAQLGCSGMGNPCEEVNDDYTATPVTGGYEIAPAGIDQPGTLTRRNP